MSRIEDEIAGLQHTVLVSRHKDASARAAASQALLHRIGAHLPLLVVADMARALTENDTTERQIPSSLSNWNAWARYVHALKNSHAATLTRRLRLPTEVAAGLAMHLLSPILSAWPPSQDPSRLRDDIPPGQAMQRGQLSPPAVAELEALFALVGHASLRLATHRERVDLETLRLLIMIETGAMAAPTAETLTTWLSLLDQPEVHDTVSFAIELLPSVMDVGTHSDVQDFAINGYAGITRTGIIADLALTELAFDDEMFLQRFLENELFYNARERTRNRETEHHLLLIDGTASMRGLRSSFARGLALSMIQQHLHAKRTVEVAFFDSALHPPTRVVGKDRGTIAILGFNTPQGRDYPRAFSEITRYARSLYHADKGRVIITFLTHGRCFVPQDIIAELMDHAEVRGLFILPGESLPTFAETLDYHGIIDEASLQTGGGRLKAARRLLDNLAQQVSG